MKDPTTDTLLTMIENSESRNHVLESQLAAALAEVERLKTENERIKAHDYTWAHQTQALLSEALDRASVAEHAAKRRKEANQALKATNQKLLEKSDAALRLIREILTNPSIQKVIAPKESLMSYLGRAELLERGK